MASIALGLATMFSTRPSRDNGYARLSNAEALRCLGLRELLAIDPAPQSLRQRSSQQHDLGLVGRKAQIEEDVAAQFGCTCPRHGLN